MKSSLQHVPIAKGMYAWNSIHAGSFLLYVETQFKCHKFIMLPGPVDYYLTFEDFTKALENHVLEFVEVLPDEIYKESLSLSCPVKQTTLVS